MPHGARSLSEGGNDSPQQMWGRVEQVAAENIGGEHFHTKGLTPDSNSKNAECHNGGNAEMNYE